MADLELADLRAVLAVCDEGGIGAAAAMLHVAQPSLSQRLARLERGLGVRLFDRGPAGTRPTAAGLALAGKARRALALVEEAGAAAREAGARPRVVAGTLSSLAPPVFAALDVALRGRAALHQIAAHGRDLVAGVVDGSVDGAVVALPPRSAAPAGTVRIPLGQDRLVLFTPAGAMQPGPGQRGPAGRDVIVYTYAPGVERIMERLVRGGASVRRAATAQTAIAMARASGDSVVLPGSAARSAAADGDVLGAAPVREGIPLSLVVPGSPSSARELLLGCAETLSAALG